MNKKEKIKIILITVAVVLTVELFVAAVLRGFGLMHVSFGRNRDSASQNGTGNEVVSELEEMDPDAEPSDNDGGDDSPDDNGSTSTTAEAAKTTTAKNTDGTTTKKPAGTTTTQKPAGTTTTQKPTTTTTKNSGGDNDGGWIDDWF